MSFIAYALHLETAAKLISCNKLVCFSDNPHDKNRIYLSGTSIMSVKLTVGKAACIAQCEVLQNTEVAQNKVKRSNFLEKMPRNQCTNKMKALLNSVVDMQAKYVDLGEFKKYSCLNIDKLVPEIKLSEEEEDEGLSDAKHE